MLFWAYSSQDTILEAVCELKGQLTSEERARDSQGLVIQFEYFEVDDDFIVNDKYIDPKQVVFPFLSTNWHLSLSINLFIL